MKGVVAQSSANEFHGIDGTYAARQAVAWFSTSGPGNEAVGFFRITRASSCDCVPSISQEQTAKDYAKAMPKGGNNNEILVDDYDRLSGSTARNGGFTGVRIQKV